MAATLKHRAWCKCVSSIAWLGKFDTIDLHCFDSGRNIHVVNEALK